MIKHSKIPRGTEGGKMQINLLKFLKVLRVGALFASVVRLLSRCIRQQSF